MITVTTENILGKNIKEHLGIVKGNTIRARWFGRDIMAGIRQIIGGEIKTYTDMIGQSREEAYNRMVNQANELGADAIIGVRFMTSMVMAGSSEMLAYGTAVKLK